MRLASRLLLVLLTLCVLFAAPVQAQVSLTALGSPYTQNFDTLATSGTANPWTDNSTLAGWYAQFSATPANPTTYRADSGGSNTGAIYSWGLTPIGERAFGLLSSGTPVTVLTAVRFVNNTGSTITSLNISYNGEQWRDGGAVTPNAQTTFFEYQVANAGTITDANTPATGWTSFSSLDITSPTFTNTGGGTGIDGNNASNRTAKSATLTVTVNPGQEVWLRWRDPNDGGNDHGMGVDDLSVTPQGSPNAPVVPSCPASLTAVFGIAASTGVSASDTDGTVTSAAITGITPSDPGTITLTGFTPAGGVGGTANATLDVSNTTPVGSYNVTIQWANNDVSPQTATCVVAVSVTTITPIHDIQGNGASSPLSGSVTTRGIVTGVKSNGFFIQEPDASVDADPATSEGIFVFTSGAPPAAAALGNLVQVTGTIAEFVPTADLLQPPLTELTSPTTVQLSTGNPLPAAIPLTAIFPDPSGPFDQLERLEGMRVSVASLTVSGPTLGNSVNEPNATQTSNGVFFGVVTGVARPFREPGIQDPDPPPSGSIPPIPRFDANPELLRVDSDGLTGAPILDVSTTAVVTGLIGPLDYTFRHYTILPDPPPSPAPIAIGGLTATAASVATSREFTVGAYNMERFFDTVDDPGIGEPVLTATAFNNRLNKASLGIRNHMGTPDIIGVVEIENLSTLQALAARISADAIAASQPDPQYAAYLSEGNDPGGIDVGFLVKTAVVTGSTPRVTVNAVVQENAGELFVNPDSSTSLLNDRPSLRLDAAVNHANGASFPVTVIVNHLRSLNGVNSIGPGSSGWATEGERVRAKRQKQAESLANLVQARQLADPAERIILVGDFNAYEFNDGLVDSMEVIAGTPPPDNETAVPADGVDLVNPDLDNLFDTPPPPERYSYVFDGQAQNIDHELVNAALIAATIARRVEHPRINTDFPAVDRNDSTTPRHLSDHDPIVGFFEVAAFATADLSITKTDGVTTAVPGGSVTYTITASNAGPDPVTGGTVADTFPAILTCTWTCVGAGGGTCTAAGSGNISDTVNLPVGGSVTYTATCTIAASATGTLANTATVSGGAADDPDSGNNSATDTDTLTPQADLAITKTDGVTTATAGGSVTYTITASNSGPSDAPGASVADTFPASLTCTWTCVGSGGGTCTAAGSGNISDTVNLPAGGSVTYTASCTISSAATGSIANTATVTAPGGVTDPDPGNNSATDMDFLSSSADLAITKTDGMTTATPGGSVTYTITASNPGPSDAPGTTVADTFPASLTCTWTCVGAGGGTCTAAGSGNINDTVNLPAGGSVTYTASCTISASATGSLVNTATVTESEGVDDPNQANNSATDTDALGAEADLAITKTDGVTTATPGGSVTYTITASNSGPSDAPGATVTDTFPASLTCTWTCVGAGGGTCTASGSGNIGDTVNLPSGGSVTYTASCTISASATGTLSNTATVTAPGGVTDPTPGNNSATDTDTLAAQADLAVTKTDGVTTATPGGSVTYTITASNSGPSDAPGATVTDTFPASLTCTWTCVGAGGGTCTASGSGNIGDTVNLPSGGSVTYTASCTISASATGTLSNTATVTAPGGVTDPAPGNNSATDSDTLTAPAGSTLSGTKSAAGSFTPGSTVTYTVVLSNAGPGTQQDNPGNEFTDVLPSSLTLVSATATSGTAVATVATNTVTWNGSIPANGLVTITITATINSGNAPGTTITNQGNFSYDANGDGTNEASGVTDSNPATPGADPTSFVVLAPGAAGLADIPTLDEVGLALLILLLGMGGAVMLRRRQA